MTVDQGDKIDFKLFDTELIGNAIVITGQSPYGAGVDIDGAGAVTMQLQTTQVLFIQRIKAFLFNKALKFVPVLRASTEPKKAAPFWAA